MPSDGSNIGHPWVRKGVWTRNWQSVTILFSLAYLGNTMSAENIFNYLFYQRFFSLSYRIAGKGRSVQSPQFTILRTWPGCSDWYPCILLDLAHPWSAWATPGPGGPPPTHGYTLIHGDVPAAMLNPSIALHETVEGSRTTWPKRCLLAWMRFPTCGSPVLFWIETLLAWSCQRTPRIFLWDFMWKACMQASYYCVIYKSCMILFSYYTHACHSFIHTMNTINGFIHSYPYN